jgi:glycosyltransferase involved in cell wall biosynthesis
MVREFGWDDRVTFVGHVPYWRDDLVELYRQADIFALPSMTIAGDKEGIPTVLAEAMAASLPCVTTFHAGIPELVEPDRQGLLVPEGDVEALAAAFGRLIRDPSLRRRLGTSGAQRVSERASLPMRTAHLEQLYDDVLQARRPARATPNPQHV